jgi:hypothetical protein
MSDTVNHVTIATSSGAVWLALLSHFAAGLVAIVTGLVALLVAKGGTTHKRVGIVFTHAMIASGLTASGIAAYEGKTVMVFGGLLSVYLAFTAMSTVKPVPGGRALDAAAMLLGFTLVVAYLSYGYVAWNTPGRVLGGAPAGMILFLGGVTLAGAIGDARVIHAGGISGPRRLARHLWRMCFALFVATGSFFLGQIKFVPEPIRIVPLLAALGVAPLLVLVYWMWRVRLRKKLSGMIVGSRLVSSY